MQPTPLPKWVVRRILYYASLDPSDGPACLAACAEAGGVLTMLSRQVNPLFRSISIRSPETLAIFHDSLSSKATSFLGKSARRITIDGEAQDTDYMEKASRVLFACDKATILDISRTRISWATVQPLPHVRKLVLDHVDVSQGTTFADIVSLFDQLEHLSVSLNGYGPIYRSSKSLPGSLRQFYMTIKEPGDEDVFAADELLQWMAMTPASVPDIEEVGVMGVTNRAAEDLILLLSYLKPVLKSVVIEVSAGHEVAHGMLLEYLDSNMVPVRSYQDFMGQLHLGKREYAILT